MLIKLSITNILIIISAFFTLLLYISPDLSFFWMNDIYLSQGKYHIYFIQFFTWTFLHWGIIHFLSNSLFMLIFWNIVELIIWRKNYILFFLFSIFFIWLGLTLFSEWNTIWISWFCMALLSFYTLKLKSLKNPDYKGWITAMFINIGIWFYPWISLLGHLFWAIAWVIFYYLLKDYLKKALISIKNFS